MIDRRRDRERADEGAVPIAPRNGGEQHEERRQVAGGETAQHRRREQRHPVAPPVPHAVQPQRQRGREQQKRRAHDARGGAREQGEGNAEEQARRRIVGRRELREGVPRALRGNDSLKLVEVVGGAPREHVSPSPQEVRLEVERELALAADHAGPRRVHERDRKQPEHDGRNHREREHLDRRAHGAIEQPVSVRRYTGSSAPRSDALSALTPTRARGSIPLDV